MGKIKMDNRDFVKLRNKLQAIKEQTPQFIEDLTNEAAGKLLAETKKNTAVGKYSKIVNFTTKDGKEVSFKTSYKKRGSTLRKGWTVGEVKKENGAYKIEIINSVEYAIYVEYGHRKVNKEKEVIGWTDGKFMFTNAKKEIEKQLPKLINKKLTSFLKRGGL